MVDIWYGMKRRMEGVSRSWIKEGLSEVLFALETLLLLFILFFKLSLLFFLLSNLFIITIIYFLYQNKNKNKI
jgi:hypothetical protein